MAKAFIRALISEDQKQISSFVQQRWGATQVVVHNTIYETSALPGFVAIEDGQWVGLLLYQLREHACEIVSLDSLQVGSGCGTALLETVKSFALQAGCSRLWLVTTNDNIEALRFYQRRAFTLSALHRGAVTEARKQKPEIPLYGNHGIPLRDEIELELPLTEKKS